MNKNVLLIAGVLILGAVGVTMFEVTKDMGNQSLTGSLPFSNLEAQSIDKIAFTKGDKNLLLKRLGEEKFWQAELNDGGNYPVEGQKIGAFLDGLLSNRVERKASSDNSLDQDLGLDQPLNIQLSSKEKTVVDLQLGNERTGGGVFFRMSGAKEAYLFAKAISASLDLSDWEYRVLLDIEAPEIKSIKVDRGKKSFSLVRQKSEDKSFKLDDQDVELTESNVKNLTSALKNLTYIDRLDPSNEEAKTAINSGHKLEIELFDGQLIEILVGSLGEEGKKTWYGKIGIASAQGESRRAKLIENSYSKWLFSLQDYQSKNLILDRSSLTFKKSG